MAKTDTKQTTETKPDEKPPETQLQVMPQGNLTDLFSRSINAGGGVKSISLKRTLTKPLISMGKLKVLAVEFTSEIYSMDLPLSGRGGGMAPARVVDVKDVNSGEECILIVHETMSSAIQRAGYRVMKAERKDDKVEQYVEVPGASVIGKAFAFRTAALKGDKGYHMIETVEIAVER